MDRHQGVQCAAQKSAKSTQNVDYTEVVDFPLSSKGPVQTNYFLGFCGEFGPSSSDCGCSERSTRSAKLSQRSDIFSKSDRTEAYGVCAANLRDSA